MVELPYLPKIAALIFQLSYANKSYNCITIAYPEYKMKTYSLWISEIMQMSFAMSDTRGPLEALLQQHLSTFTLQVSALLRWLVKFL